MKKTKIAVAGTGYVGLSNAILLSLNNEVTAYDINEEKINMIKIDKKPICIKYGSYTSSIVSCTKIPKFRLSKHEFTCI